MESSKQEYTENVSVERTISSQNRYGKKELMQLESISACQCSTSSISSFQNQHKVSKVDTNAKMAGENHNEGIITIEQFAQLTKGCKVVEAEKVEGTDKLLKIKLQLR